MALPFPSSPHWAPSTTLAGTFAEHGDRCLNALDVIIICPLRWEAVMKVRKVAQHHGTEAPRGRSKASDQVGMHEMLSYRPGSSRSQATEIMQEVRLHGL